jgi:Zn-dependent metalloprotease
MKQFINIIYVCAYLVVTPLSAFAQDISKSVFKYDQFGNVESVVFSKTDKEYEYIKSEDVFFKDILKTRANNTFVRNKKIRLDKGHETFDQYYKGIKVEDAGYTFHYDKNGNMRYAHGNYVDITDLDIIPAISKEDAAKSFAKYKGLSPDSITQSSAELVIKRIKGIHPVEIPILAYKVSIAVNNVCVTEYGYVDAKTGDVAYSESYIYYSAATGTFYTKYYGTKYATTNWENGYYYLYDPSRGYGIDIKDLQNYDMSRSNYQNHVAYIKDSDNTWYYNDHNDSTFMAYDIHWAFQKIYDRLYNVYGKNSIDNNGKEINAYIRATFSDNRTDNACWAPSREEFYFGQGGGCNRPFSSLDIVAHEYGHGITHYQIGWSNQKYLNEGLSDIWGAIMDYRFGDANSVVWKIGEHIIPSKTCIRDMEYPENPYAYNQTASTYNSTDYNYYENNNDYYAMSGVFSHWFYLLVNGGQGYNSNGTYYILNPVGMDMAENLIVEAVFNNYLRYKTSYAGVREAFVAAAEAMNNDSLVTAVCNAWYAVGVGEMNLSLSGPKYTKNQSTFTVDGLPSGFDVVWSLSDNYYYQNCLQPNYPSFNRCKITTDSYHDMINATLTATIKHNSVTIKTLTMTGLYAYKDFRGQYTSGNLSGTIDYTHVFTVKPNINTFITSPMLIGASATYSNTGTIPNYWGFSSLYGELQFHMPTNNYGIPVIINVDDVCGNSYQLYAMPQNSKNLNVSFGDNGITIVIEENGYSSKDKNVHQPWTIEVCNALTGKQMSVLSRTGQLTTVSTAGWPKGMYVVKVTIGKEVFTEKVMVK